MSIKRTAIVIVGIALLAIGVIRYIQAERLRAAEQLLDFRERLTLGMSPGEVQKLIQSADYSDLSLDSFKRFGMDNVWVVQTPLQCAANNWVLYLFFKDQSLSRISVRTPDIPTMQAPGSPPDIEAK
jgi:hypothetical protein